MNPEINPREELELRVTSLLLGELSAAEAAAVRAAIAQDAELQKFHDDIKQTIYLVREATVSAVESAPEQSEPLKLSEERRQSLRAAFVIPPLKPEHIKVKRERQWLVPVAALVTVLAMLGVWLFVTRREGEGYLAFNEVLGNPAPARTRSVTSLSGKRLGEGDGRVQVSGQLDGQVDVTTFSGKASETVTVGALEVRRSAGAGPQAKPPTDLDFRTWGMSASTRGFYDDNYASANPAPAAPVQNSVTLNYQNLDALPAEPKLAPPPTEIVLPKSGDRDGDALQIAGTSGVVAGNGFFAESDRRSGGGQGGGGAGGGGNSEASIFRLDVNRNGWFDDSSLGTGPQNRGEEVSRVENLGEVESAAPTFTERLSKIKSFAASGAVGSGEAHGEHVAGVVVNGDAAAPEPNALQKALSSTTISGYADTSGEWSLKQDDATLEDRGDGSNRKADGYNLNAVKLSETEGVKVPVLGDKPNSTIYAYGTARVAPAAPTAPGSKAESVLNKSGSGTLTLGGENLYTDGTFVSGGTLAVDGGTTDGSAVVKDVPVLGRVFRSGGNDARDLSEAQRADVRRSLADAKVLFDQGKSDDAVSVLSGAVAADPGNAAAAYYLSQAKERQHAEATLTREIKSKERILEAEKAWDTSAASGTRSTLQVATNAVADPEWTGLLERSDRAHSASNRFVARYAYLAPASTPSKPGSSGEASRRIGGKELDQKSAAAKDTLVKLNYGLNITDAEASGTGASASLDYNTVQIINARMLEDMSELDRTEKRYQTLSAMTDEEKRKVIPTVAPDLQLNEFSAQLNLAEQALIKASKDYSPDDPRYKSTKELVDNLSKKVSDRVDGVMAGQKAQADALRAGIESRSNQLATAKRTDIERAKATQPYWDKKRELDGLLAFNRVLEQRVAIEKVDASLPRTSMVTIYTRAIPPAASDPGVLGRIGRAFKGDYQAKAQIRLDPGVADVAEVSGGRLAAGYDPYFIQTEFEVMKSEAVLTNVVKALDLNNKWGTNRSGGKPLKTSEAVELLRQRIELKPVRSTMFTDIVGKSSDPNEAATIANAVAEAYEIHRLAELKRASEGGIRALQESFNQQQAKTLKTSAELEVLRKKLGVSDAEAVAPRLVPDAPLPRKPAPVAQPEILTSENNFSTFSLNVSDVSFKLAAASLEKGQMPDPASIRCEEFINAFDYRDPEPAVPGAVPLLGGARGGSSPIAFAWERARYPFAHNRDLLRFSLKTAAAGRQAGRPLNVVLLLDNSGSMERADRVGIIREALRVLASQLLPQDRLSVITFARTPRLVADGVTGDKAGEVAEQISGLTPEGGTNLEDAMNLAYQTATKHFLANGINRVVMLTDGAANLGNVEPESLKQKVEAQRRQGIALDCFGIGWDGFNDDLLEVLSRNGDGRYGFLNSPEEAATEFAGQLAGALKVAASDVKVQVEFNPKRVTAYRQIGYAKHQLTKEQFRDNTVDAAEIAAQEAGNALYTVEVNPSGTGPLATVRCRYKIPGTTDYREQAWDVPFNGNAVSLKQSSAAMRLATTASAFSEWLAVNPFAGEVTPDALLNTLSGVPEVFGADSRPKKLEWMIRQAKSLEGK